MLCAVRSVMWQAAAMSRRRAAGSRAMANSTRAWLVRKCHCPACSLAFCSLHSQRLLHRRSRLPGRAAHRAHAPLSTDSPPLATVGVHGQGTWRGQLASQRTRVRNAARTPAVLGFAGAEPGHERQLVHASAGDQVGRFGEQRGVARTGVGKGAGRRQSAVQRLAEDVSSEPKLRSCHQRNRLSLLARDAVTSSAGVRSLAVEGGMVQPCSFRPCSLNSCFSCARRPPYGTCSCSWPCRSGE
jgi:hypothetical protein